MRRNEGIALLTVLILSILMFGMVAAVVSVSVSFQRSARESAWKTKALYSAEGALAVAHSDLATGGTGEVQGSINTVPYTTTVSEEDGVVIVHAVADKSYRERGAYYSVKGYYTSEVIQIPRIAAVYVEPGTELTLNGNALSVNGNTTFGLATGGEVEAQNLLDQIDFSQYGQIQGLEAPGSVGDVAPIDVDDLFSSLEAVTGNLVTYLPGDQHLSGNGSGEGVLLIGGDLHVTGSYTFTGLVIVKGDVILAGGGDNLHVFGALVTTGDFTISGSADVEYDAETLAEIETEVNMLDTRVIKLAQVNG